MRKLAFEVITALVLIGVLKSNAREQMRPLLLKAALSEAKILANFIGKQQILYRTEHGEWPDPSSVDTEIDGGNPIVVGKLEPGPGWVSVRLKSQYPELNGRTISFRAAMNPKAPAGPIHWLCGNERPVSGYVPIGENKTDVPQIYLGTNCGG